jgi:hypothetical protein
VIRAVHHRSAPPSVAAGWLTVKAILGGVVLTGLTMLFPYEFCLNGPGRGIPFAASCPVCEGTFASIGGGDGKTARQVLDLLRLSGDILLWSGACVGVLALLNRSHRPTFRC